MHLVRVSNPEWPVDFSELRLHVRDANAADAADVSLVQAYIAAASENVQEITRRAVCEQTFDLHLDEFPLEAIELPLPPLQSVASVTYRDWNGDVQTWAAENYVVDTAGSRVYPAAGKYFPATQAVPNAVTIRFTCGYPRVLDVPTTPESIRAAILLLAADLYENREGQSTVALHENRTVDRLLWPYRVF